MAKLPHALPDKSWNPAELPLNPCKSCCAVESNDPRHLLEDDSPSLSANHASFLPRIFVECGGCGSRGPYGPSTWAAVDRWNILHNVPLSEFRDGMFYGDPCKPTKDPAIGGCGVKADLKTSPCIALADRLQLIDCALDTAQAQAENCRAEREKLQAELDGTRQQMEADAETARMAREILLCEIRSLKEDRERLQSRIALLEGQRSKPGLIGRLLKGFAGSEKRCVINPKLPPCPFCREWKCEVTQRPVMGSVGHRVECHHCGVCGPWSTTPDDAAKWWGNMPSNSSSLENSWTEKGLKGLLLFEVGEIAGKP